jgi:hypothetical protein
MNESARASNLDVQPLGSEGYQAEVVTYMPRSTSLDISQLRWLTCASIPRSRATSCSCRHEDQGVLARS